jgi:hypothetical protein
MFLNLFSIMSPFKHRYTSAQPLLPIFPTSKANFTEYAISIDDEQLRSDFCVGSMGFGVVSDLVTHAGLQSEFPTILEFGLKFAVQAKKYVAFVAPVISKIARRIVNHPNPDVAEMLCAPMGQTALARVFRAFNLRPVRNAEGELRYFHGDSSVCLVD